MGLFKKLMKNIQDQSVSIERLPKDFKGIKSLPVDATPVSSQPAYTPAGLEALIRPPRTDPGNQEDMRKLMEMQRQTFRSFLAPPPPPPVSFPIDGGDLGLPMKPGIPMPPGTTFLPRSEVNYAPSRKQIQDALDDLPRGVPVAGIGSVPMPDIPYQIPQITTPVELPKLPVDLPLNLPIQVPPVDNFVMPEMPIGLPAIQLPFEIPTLPQVAMMPNVSPVAMPAMRLARANPSDFGAIGRGDR